MLVSSAALGQALGRTLGEHPAVLMRGHGAVVVGASLPQAVARSVYMEIDARLAAQASDARSQLDDLSLGVGAQRLGGGVTPPLPAPSAVATATWNTLGVADGAQTLLAVAIDRAGNRTLVSRSVIVDNTPPDTRITGGPSATMPDAATFDFTGGDNLTPVASLAFAWRVDGGHWSAFGSATRVTVSGLVPGSHLFEVKARDLAGIPIEAHDTSGGEGGQRAEQALLRHHHRHAGIGGNEGQPVGGMVRLQRYVGSACLEDGQEPDRHRDRPLESDADADLGPYAEVEQPMGQAVGVTHLQMTMAMAAIAMSRCSG